VPHVEEYAGIRPPQQALFSFERCVQQPRVFGETHLRVPQPVGEELFFED
jgi:hypothetical protein